MNRSRGIRNMTKVCSEAFPKFSRLLLALGVVLVFGSAIWVVQQFKSSDPFTRKDDIYYNYVEGQRILEGVNPYSRIHTGDMLKNDKYATYFPGFYLLSAGAQACGARDPQVWLALWRVIFALFYLAIGVLVFIEGRRCHGAVFALFGAALWFFNRWTIYVIDSACIDFPPIFFFLLSLALFEKRKRMALLFLGVSLALKQIAVLALPLYLIWAWQSSPGSRRIANTLGAVLRIAAVPVACAIPFLLWDATGFIKSILFSATRLPDAHLTQSSIDLVLGWPGLAGRIPMLVACLFIYFVAAKKSLGRYASAMCVMMTFNLLNPVFFIQYFNWAAPLVPLALCEGKRQFVDPPSGETSN